MSQAEFDRDRCGKSGRPDSAAEMPGGCTNPITATTKKIGIIKDIAAAGVGTAILAWILVLGFGLEEMLRRLF